MEYQGRSLDQVRIWVKVSQRIGVLVGVRVRIGSGFGSRSGSGSGSRCGSGLGQGRGQDVGQGWGRGQGLVRARRSWCLALSRALLWSAHLARATNQPTSHVAAAVVLRVPSSPQPPCRSKVSTTTTISLRVTLLELTHRSLARAAAAPPPTPTAVSLKWGKEVVAVELDPSESIGVFKMQVYSLTRVPPEGQKSMFDIVARDTRHR